MDYWSKGMKFVNSFIKELLRSPPKILYVLGILSVVTSGALWGSGGVPVRISYNYGMNALTLATLRITIASLFMAIFAIARGRKDVFFLKKRELFPSFISGLFGVAICFTAAALAMGRIPIGLTFVLINTAPLWVMSLAWVFWHQRVTRFQVVALVMGIWGVWVAVGGVRLQPYNVLGLLAGLGAGLGYAIYVLNGKHGMGRTDPFKAYVQMFFWGALCLWVMVFLTGEIRGIVVKHWQAWLSILYITLFSDIGGYAFLMLALRVIPGGVAAIVSMSEIPFSMLWSWLFLAEIPTRNAFQGGTMIILAVTLLSLERCSFRREIKENH